MVTTQDTINMSMKGYETKPVPALAAPEQAPQLASVPGLVRSPIMLASLPNVGSGPDAILAQHLGGRPAPGGRFFSL